MGSEGERFFGTPKQQAVGSTPAGFTNLTKIVHFTRGFDKNPRLKWTIFCVQRAQRNMRPIGTSKNGRFLLDDKEYIAELSTIAMRNLQRPRYVMKRRGSLLEIEKGQFLWNKLQLLL